VNKTLRPSWGWEKKQVLATYNLNSLGVQISRQESVFLVFLVLVPFKREWPPPKAFNPFERWNVTLKHKSLVLHKPHKPQYSRVRRSTIPQVPNKSWHTVVAVSKAPIEVTLRRVSAEEGVLIRKRLDLRGTGTSIFRMSMQKTISVKGHRK